MATTISNPASFSSVRTAFNSEGYGISTSFFAYRQGGGIVPATSGFNAIGAGNGGDPLRLTQFNGFVVPSPQTVNIADYTGYASDSNLEYAIASSSYQLFGDGTVYWAKQEGGLATDGYLPGEWLTSGSASGISAKATILSSSNSSGAAINGTFGSWIDITAVQPQWNVNATAITNFGPVNESAYVQFTLQLAQTSDLTTILDSATITLQAIVDAFT